MLFRDVVISWCIPLMITGGTRYAPSARKSNGILRNGKQGTAFFVLNLDTTNASLMYKLLNFIWKGITSDSKLLVGNTSLQFTNYSVNLREICWYAGY